MSLARSNLSVARQPYRCCASSCVAIINTLQESVDSSGEYQDVERANHLLLGERQRGVGALHYSIQYSTYSCISMTTLIALTLCSTLRLQ